MKNFGLLLFVLSTLLLPATASAHVLKTDRTIGAVMHTDPDDAPVAAEPTAFYFDITDTTNRFSTSSCACSIVITEAGKQVFTTALSHVAAGAASFSYTFTQADTYTVELLGVPATPDAFQAFSLSYSVRVTGATSPPSKTSEASTVFLGIVIVGALFALYIAFRPAKPKN